MQRPGYFVVWAFATALGPAALAQSGAEGADSIPLATCSHVAGSASYRACAFWLDGNRLRRGSHGEVIARTGLFHIMPLHRHVVGDSAQAYARSFARDTRRANVLVATGVVFQAAALLVLQSYECRSDPILGYCTTQDDEYGFASAALLLTAAGFTFASIPFTLRARRHAARAVLWHNERFAR